LAAWISRIFGLDPMVVLDATADEMDIRIAAARAAARQINDERR